MSAPSEPQFRSLDLPQKHVTRAWMAAIISAGFALIFGVLGAAGLLAAPGLDAWILIDAVILGALAYGVWKRSRFCAVLLLVYGLGAEVFAAFDETARFSLLRLVFIYFYLRGAVQLFRDYRSHTEAQAAKA